ncbi:MAG: hypothetical protein AB8G22_27665, partial [Saprospiraceae bacterium]
VLSRPNVSSPYTFQLAGLAANGQEEMYEIQLFNEVCNVTMSDFYTAPLCEAACNITDYIAMEDPPCIDNEFDFELEIILENPSPDALYDLTVELAGGNQGMYQETNLSEPLTAYIPNVVGDGTEVPVSVTLEETNSGCTKSFNFNYQKPSCFIECEVISFEFASDLTCSATGDTYDAEFEVSINAEPHDMDSVTIELINSSGVFFSQTEHSPPPSFTMTLENIPNDGQQVRAEAILDGEVCAYGDTTSLTYTPPNCNFITFAVGEVCTTVDSEIIIPITTSNFTNINGFQYTMYVDPTFATITKVDDFGLPNWDANDFTINNSTGVFTLTYLGDFSTGDELSDGTVLFNIYATAVADAGMTSIVEFRNEPTPKEVLQNLQVVEAKYESASVCILDQLSISGTVQTPFAAAIDSVKMTMTGNNTGMTYSEMDGTYQVSILEMMGETTVTPTKSDNPQKGVSIQDAIFIKEHALERQMLDNPYLEIAADVDGSGSVTIVDVVRVKQMIRGELGIFPVGETWIFIPADYEFTDTGHPTGFPTAKTYTDLESDVANENYIGIKYGDVTGDAVSN